MSEQLTSTPNQAPAPRGVFTNPAIVNSAKKSKGPKQPQKDTCGAKDSKPKGQRRRPKDKGRKEQSDTVQSQDHVNLNKILYPDMFDDKGNRSAVPAEPTPMPPVTPQRGSAFAGSSFHSAPAASSLPKPSFAGPTKESPRAWAQVAQVGPQAGPPVGPPVGPMNSPMAQVGPQAGPQAGPMNSPMAQPGPQAGPPMPQMNSPMGAPVGYQWMPPPGSPIGYPPYYPMHPFPARGFYPPQHQQP